MIQGNLSGLNFNAEEVEPQNDFEPFAAGWKLSVISDSELKPTKKGDGSYLQLEWTIVEGEDEVQLRQPLTQPAAQGNLVLIVQPLLVVGLGAGVPDPLAEAQAVMPMATLVPMCRARLSAWESVDVPPLTKATMVSPSRGSLRPTTAASATDG